MSGEWRIAAEDRRKYENYFQQCGPDQGFVTGERARAFFLQSKLPEDILRKIWDLADLNHDGRLDKREFAIACHLIRSQVSKLAPMPSTLPPTLLADAMLINSNGSSFPPPPPPQTPLPFSLTPANTFFPLTPNVRSKYLQQFHSIVDVSKSHGYMSASQAKNLLEQKHLSQTILRQVWDLADADKDGRLTADEFVIAMHCCDVVQAGGTLPKRLPDEWSHTKIMQRERIGSIHLDDESSASNTVQRKNSDFSFEDKRKANYLNGEKELERRREFLREQEERERREREEREKKRQFELEKQKEEQERQRRLEIERQLERQRQIEQQKEEERKKMLEQREAARREMERKSRLEWERQRMQELSIQKTRLLEQITDFKSREKALDLEIQTMEENISTSRRKIDQSNGNVQTIDQSIADLQKKTNEERNNYQTLEQQRKDLLVKFKRVQNERETIESSYRQMSQSKDFNLDRQENEQMRVIQSQIQSIKQETAQTDQQIQQFTQLYQSYQRQLEQFRSQLAQFEQDVKRKSPAKTVTFSPQTSIAPSPAPAPAVARPTAIVDPFQTVDPFAFPSDVVSSPSSTKRRAPTIPNEKFVQYRALYDYSPLHDDELAIRTGDVIQVNPSAQQGTDWLFGKLSNGQEGYFPANYAERVEEKETKNNRQSNGTQYDTTSTLTPGSWVIAIADCQGKTADKHLSFQQGDCILVQTQHDQSWYSGQLNGKVGWFPRNYVRPANEQEIPSKTNTNDSTNSANGSSGVVWRERSALPTIPEVYVAIHPYQAIEPSDLSFDVGERITVLERDGDWWLGRIGQRSGTFPRNYVEKVETPLLETAVAIAPFHSTDEGRLSFDLGQLMYIRKKGDKGWYQGELRIPDQPIQVGWFPANCVQIQSAGSAATRTTSMNSSSTPSYLNTTNYPRYIALFPYTAQQNDELSFPADAIFEVLDVTEDNNWFTARYNNQVGLIPATYVQPYQSSSSNLVSTPRIARQPPTLSAPDSSSINTTLSDADTSLSMCSNPSRISAIRELIETEQRYIDDLEIVHHDVIETLKQVHLLSEHESKEIFLNWKNLIDRNEILLNALKDQVDYKDPPSMQRNNRSASMSNIALAALPTHSAEILVTKRLSHAVDSHHRSFTPDVAQSSPHRRLKHRSGKHQRSPSNVALAALPAVSLDTSGTSMTINDATQIGQILCEHLPNMEDDYLHYCSARAQANRILQSKIDNSEKFRSLLNIFQERTGGLSLNGFLTKPIQRVTRYPLLIEKILKHTPMDHPDHPFVKQALEIARKINEQINQQISDQESQTRLDWLQQHLIFGSDDNNADGYIFDELLKFNSLTKYNVPRQLILHGFVIKVPGGKELLAFLFNDFLLFATMKSSSSNWQTQIFETKSNLQLKLYKMPILLSDIIIANDVLNDQFSFSITTKIYEKAVILKTLQTNVRTLWVKSINNAVEEYQAAERSVLSDRAMFTIPDAKRDTRSALARLLLVVQEAQELMPSRNTLDRHRSVDPYCEITVGSLTLRTPFIKRTINPKWNAPMQFLIYNFHEEILHIHVFDHEFFSPNESLGSTSINLVDILPYPLETFLTQPSLPFTQKIYLNNGASVIIKFVIQFLQNSQ